jgi:hypothetical protein
VAQHSMHLQGARHRYAPQRVPDAEASGPRDGVAARSMPRSASCTWTLIPCASGEGGIHPCTHARRRLIVRDRAAIMAKR